MAFDKNPLNELHQLKCSEVGAIGCKTQGLYTALITKQHRHSNNV